MIGESVSESCGRAGTLPAKYGKVGILIDTSASMAGNATQPLRPIATAMAVRDTLAAASAEAAIRVSGGLIEGRLILPEGDTDLATLVNCHFYADLGPWTADRPAALSPGD